MQTIRSPSRCRGLTGEDLFKDGLTRVDLEVWDLDHQRIASREWLQERLRGNARVQKSSCVAKLMSETQSISEELEEFWTWGGSLSQEGFKNPTACG